MCLGGPNHCRVGRAGSQSYYLSIDCRSLLVDVDVHLRSLCCVRQLYASCSSSCGDAEYNVFITLVHTRTHKKKNHPIHNELAKSSEMRTVVQTSLAFCSTIYIMTSFFQLSTV
jgi:hypothetical protein